jgi:hypothetical protein
MGGRRLRGERSPPGRTGGWPTGQVAMCLLWRLFYMVVQSARLPTSRSMVGTPVDAAHFDGFINEYKLCIITINMYYSIYYLFQNNCLETDVPRSPSPDAPRLQLLERALQDRLPPGRDRSTAEDKLTQPLGPSPAQSRTWPRPSPSGNRERERGQGSGVARGRTPRPDPPPAPVPVDRPPPTPGPPVGGASAPPGGGCSQPVEPAKVRP